jgi:hypothetical protein
MLSILIVNWNTRQMLADCLRSVAGEQGSVFSVQCSVFSDQWVVEIIVVDNASSDGSVVMVREQFPQVKLIENRENVGFARANNQAIAAAQGKYLLLLNSDTVVEAGALETLVQFMEQTPPTGAVGARLLNGDGSLQPSCQPMLTPNREFGHLLFLDKLIKQASYPMHTWNTDTPRQVEVIKGACLLVRREVLDAVGWLDAGYFMYTEEVDLCYRIAQAGWELWYVPQAVVTHYGEASTRQIAEEMYVQLYRSKVQFYRKFGGERRARQFKYYLHVAYWPRLWAISILSLFDPKQKSRKKTYQRLLTEISQM